MSTPFSDDLDDKVIDITPTRPKKRHRKLIALIVVVIVLLFALFRSVSIYISAIWFDSLGYSSVYWYIFRAKLFIFLIFAALTIIILRAAFWLLERTFSASTLERRTIMVNNQAVHINPGKLFRPVAWILSIILGLGFGAGMKDGWREIALYLHQPVAAALDPVFHKPLSFYLFSLPVHLLVSRWLLGLSIVILIFTGIFAILANTQKQASRAATEAQRRTSYAAISFALAAFLLLLAWRVYLARFPYLWEDHQSFSGVTYTEDNYYLPALTIVAITLIVAAIIIIINALTRRKLRLIVGAVALPILVYIVAGMIIPAYVQSFVVKPNELGRETPYIQHNINWTRAAFKLENIESRDFEADSTLAGLQIENNQATLNNIRLWDWSALLDTLRQIQEIRPYYDFQDVDIDRYQVGGQVRQMMVAARELDVAKLPEQSRTWINEKLIYTHGYGVTMNTSNEFTPEGMPPFILSNMPIESTSPDIKLTRPEIYFGQKTDTDVYVKTKQEEFNYPQGETDNTNVYEGTGGIRVGGFFHRLLLAWALNDLSKLPFSDYITPDSRLLMRRNINDRVRALAPYLIYDKDPYIVVTNDGRLFWIIDAFTESMTYPYSTHHQIGDQTANYIRNSVKVTIDAYNGDVNFYVFDADDPIIQAYRGIFPALFKDAGQMPATLRAHVRYPETLIRVQGDVFGLYHTTNPSVFFQRNDVWSVASRQVNQGQDKQQTEPLEPYFVLMQLPGEQIQNEFVEILPFTPANKQNMIGWMAGRSDGDQYGHLLVYNFPRSRLIDGPNQIEARINQDPQLSAQFSLWNQQGSRLRPGNLLVIPIGHALLYVQPVYLQAERSPMPELRLVVLATQEHLVFGSNFQEAVTKLFGQGANAQAPTQTGGQQKPQPEQPNAQPTPAASPQPNAPQTPAMPATTQQLINRAADDFAEYQRLTAEGKLGEAGQKLDALKRDLEDLKKATGKQ